MNVYDPDIKTPPVALEDPEAMPVREIRHDELNKLGLDLRKDFEQYSRDRKAYEDQCIRNLRQYRGIYDPEIEREIGPNRSKAYPRVTRVKCISVLSRIMELMFPGNEKNWKLGASPSADMSPEDVQAAVQAEMAKQPPGPDGQPAELTLDMAFRAVQKVADKRAKDLSKIIDDQLAELGSSQDDGYVALNRKVLSSGILYGVGVLRGPFVRESKDTRWELTREGMVTPREVTRYKPQFEVLPMWDFYPDMSSKNLRQDMDGYFTRLVMSASQLRKLAKRSDFYSKVIKAYIREKPTGDYKPKPFEQDLKNMGTRIDTAEDPNVQGARKYEIITWYGPVSCKQLVDAGVDIPKDKQADEVEAEIWMLGSKVIKADMSPWYKLGVDIKTIHTFVFDEDDSSPLGNGLPNIVRDSQMSIAAATRMLLDNASVTCGPNIEVNTELLRDDQDLTSISAYKIWYRDDMGSDANIPAVRNITIDAHIPELMKMIEMFLGFADMETFVGPATGGDMAKTPSEPMRTAAGASMLRGDAALPFKDIIRNFDCFTQSVISTLVHFNRKFNPSEATQGDFNVIARGATSLVAKEVRGMQLDQLVATLTDEEKMHVDDRKMATARFAVRDLEDMLISEEEAKQRIDARSQKAQEMESLQMEQIKAEIKKTMTEAIKDMAQADKNRAGSEATTIGAATKLVEAGAENELANAVREDASSDRSAPVQGNAAT